MKKLHLMFVLLLIISCKQSPSDEKIPVEPDNGIGNDATPPPVLSFSENIEEAHNKAAFMNKEAVSFDIVLKFGGNTRLDAKVSMTTNSSRVRLDKADGSTMIYDGNDVFMSPETANAEGARFDIFTWQYFFAMPFKLTDPGTVWDKMQPRILDSLEYETAKLSFKPDIGDSPDDWYVVYKDTETNRLKAAAYIVTFSQTPDMAEENPHAIVYNDYRSVENVDLATKWSFHNWDEEKGIGEKLGEASLTNLRFFSPDENYFTVPANSEKVSK